VAALRQRHYQLSNPDGGDYGIADPMAVVANGIVNDYLNAAKGAGLDHWNPVTIGYVTAPDFRYAIGVPEHVEHRFIK
jgi:hypothetical protein